jgi:diaminohydroxyphosphoribosylaminopyrimidine deaminase/5-amino-6-(5-phosphoribosylamino)uracil reductase
MEAEAHRLLAPFAKLATRGLPFVTAKWAMSLDGKTACRTGDSRWVSSAPSRELVHELRGQSDAVMVGIGTALADDPLLTARPPGPRTPARIVVDSRARLPLDCQLVGTARETPVLLATTEAAPGGTRSALEARGVEVLVLPERGGRTDLQELMAELGRRRMTNVLLEGGGELCAAVLARGLADRLLVFVAPKIIGGRDAPTPVGGEGAGRMAEALLTCDWVARTVGDDLLIEAWLTPSQSTLP